MKFKPSQTKGFTLLELLISLTIIGVIVTIISGALRIGIRAWEKGEQDVDIRQRQRVVLDLMRRQLTSICIKKIKQNAKKSVLFQGQAHSLQFLSFLSLIPNNNMGIVYVQYQVEKSFEDKSSLFFYEKNILLMNPETDFEPVEDDFYQLISGTHNISFEYLKKDKDNVPEWQSIWEPEHDKGFPLAVRITLKKDRESSPIRVIARMDREQGI